MSEFVRNLEDVFAQFGQIRAKRMFGGYGIYYKDVMIGIVADDVLYLKADEKTVDAFAECDLPPFEYEKHGKKIKMSYYVAPDVLFDNPEQAKEWGVRAYAAALRARHPKQKRGTRKK